MFERLNESQPSAITKVVPLTGDINLENLGLKPSTIDDLVNQVNVVFHMAATLKLESNLKDALEHNTRGTARIIEICRNMKNLEAFLHFSTAFCSADISVFEERVSMTRSCFVEK